MKLSKGLGLERIQLESSKILLLNINAEIARMNEAWAVLDQQYAAALGKEYTPIIVEDIDVDNIYPGHRPSLILAPINRYPNLSVMTYQAYPDTADNVDQIHSYRNRLFIELMVKSPDYEASTLPGDKDFEAERVVNSRIQRTTDAVHNIMISNKTLNGLVADIGRTPTVIISDVFERKENTSYGNTWLWQASRLEYEIGKVSGMEDSLGSHIREGLNVDQI